MSNAAWIETPIDKRLVRGMLDFLILKRLSEGDCHGYGLTNYFRRRFRLYFGPSIIYPTLENLAGKGLIERFGEIHGVRPRKMCRITVKGLAVLKKQKERMEALSRVDRDVAVLVDSIRV